MAAPPALCAYPSELRASPDVADNVRSDQTELASLISEGEMRDMGDMLGFDQSEESDSRHSLGAGRPFTPAPCNFPKALLPFRERLWHASPAATVSSFVDWSRLVAVETTEALNDVPDFPDPPESARSGGASARNAGTPRKSVALEVNSGGQVFFGLLSPLPGTDQEEAVVIKFCNSRHMLQSEQMAAELAWHLEVTAPVSRLLLKVHDSVEWQALLPKAEGLSTELHEALQRKQSMLLLQFIRGDNLRAEKDAWEGSRLTDSCNSLGRLTVLDMLLGNSDRLPIRSLGWRGNPSNVLWSTSTKTKAGHCVPIDAVVARRPPRLLVQETDQKVGSALELALLDRKSAQQVLLEAVSCNSAGVAAITADWAPNEASWAKKWAGVAEEARPPHSAVKAFHEGVRGALALAVREQGLLEMIVDVVRSWLDTFMADMNDISTAASAKLNETRLLMNFNRQANTNGEVKSRLSSWQTLLQDKSHQLRQAADDWAARRNVNTAMSFKGFLGDTVINPIADAYELLVRLQHLIARCKVMANAGNATRPADLSPTPLFVGPATSCCFHLLIKLGVTCIINCTKDLVAPTPETLGSSLKWHRLAIEDTEGQDISHAVEEGLKLIDDVINAGGRVLVHCHEGKSRSISLCLAYMVTREKKSLQDAMTFIKSKRPVARPNAGFLKQLLALELSTLGSNSVALEDLPKGKPTGFICDLCGESVGLSEESLSVHKKAKHPELFPRDDDALLPAQVAEEVPKLPAQVPALPEMPQLPAQVAEELPKLPAQVPAEMPQLPAQVAEEVPKLPDQVPAEMPQLPAQVAE